MLLAIVLGWREYQRQVREHPERFPWTALDLADPIGPFTAQKIASLEGETAQCHALLRSAQTGDRPEPPLRPAEPACGYADGMRLARVGAGAISYRPAGLVTACPVAAALHLWERELQAAAIRHLGTRVEGIDHFGSYSCRRLHGARSGAWSEHATADAVDIAGVRLADGRRLTILADWDRGGGEARFLRDARDSACRLFSTTLSPEYNAAHRDHLHLDLAARGRSGWTVCR